MPLPSWITDSAFVFLSLFIQGMPFLFLGALISGFVGTFVPIRSLLSHIPKNPVVAALSGGALGFLLPSCECVGIPLLRRFFQQGLPLSAGLAYLLAAPVLNPVCLFSTWAAYQGASPWFMLGMRAAGGLILAVVIALVLSRLSPARLLRGEMLLPNPQDLPLDPLDPALPPSASRFQAALAASLSDFRQVAGFYLAGSLFAAAFQILLPPEFLPAGTSWWATPAMMALAILLSVCSSADAFLANSFIGFPVHSQLAFLWTGPVLDLKLLLVYQSIFQRRAVALLALLVLIVVSLLTWLAFILP